jgi:general stress protein YciG
MAIRPNSEERSTADRERQRQVSNESGRSARGSGGESVGRADSASDPGSGQRARSNRGFASMDRGKQREIASKGGRAAHQKGTAHEFDSSEARAAGRKGGVTVSKNREHMAAIGRRGGEARGANRAARMQQGSSSSASAAQSGSQTGSQRFSSDREVGFGNGAPQATPVNAGPRQSGNSLGGERNAAAVPAERNVERP